MRTKKKMIDEYNAIYGIKNVVEEHDRGNRELFESGENMDKYPYMKLFASGLEIAAGSDCAKMTVLDVGCGAGWLGVYLKRKGILEQFPYTGIDAASAMCELARKNLPEGEFATEDLFSFNTDRKWDIVCACGVMESIIEWREFLEKMASLSNGWIFLHKLFLTDHPERMDEREAYGRTAIRIENNRRELTDKLSDLGFVLRQRYHWHGYINSMLLERITTI